jgi:hypothetical protein
MDVFMSEQSQNVSAVPACGVQLHAQILFPFFCGTHIISPFGSFNDIIKIVLKISSI